MLDIVLGTDSIAVNKIGKILVFHSTYLPWGRETINKLNSMSDENMFYGEKQSREGG